MLYVVIITLAKTDLRYTSDALNILYLNAILMYILSTLYIQHIDCFTNMPKKFLSVYMFINCLYC